MGLGPLKLFILISIIIAIILGLVACRNATYILKSPTLDSKKNKEYVVVLHGLYINPFYMAQLSNYLSKNGYDVINIGYPSTKYDLETLAKHVEKEINTHIEDKSRIVNFVGYSLGGVVLRAVHKNYRPVHMGRVVQIGVPNKGSEVADRLSNIQFFTWLFGPILKQLVTKQEHIQHLFGEIDYELGVIVSKNSRNILFRKFFSGDNDGLVAVNSALLDGAKDSYIIDATHELMPFNKEIMRQTLFFIRDGHFKK